MVVVVVGGANPVLIHLHCLHLFNTSDAANSVFMYVSMILLFYTVLNVSYHMMISAISLQKLCYTETVNQCVIVVFTICSSF